MDAPKVYTHEVKKYESMVISKRQNRQKDRRVIERMLRHTSFVNSMSLMLGTYAGNNLYPQE